MTIRLPVSTIKNNWHDAQRVDVGDMDVEQTAYLANDACIINNHMGTGVLLSSPTPAILFDSDSLDETQASLLASGNFDGTGLQVAEQPSDSNLGNQLEVELTNSTVFGRFSVKVLIVGLDFQDTPQYDRFVFHKNEKQVSKKHYKEILAIFFNDFKGNNNCSRDFGGRITIKEAASYQLSRDPIMVAQDVEPNIFFRDFKLPDPLITLANTIQTGMGNEYSVNSLNINTTVKLNRTLSASDVTSKVGQKFKATTNNIQKITLLLGAARDDSASVENRFDWSGDIVISVYELQTTVSCPTDIVPELAIDFDPKSQPLAQLSFSKDELYDNGYILTDVLQPVDFVLSDTQLGSTTNSIVVPGRYYVFTINRSGSAHTGGILIGVGNDKLDDSRETLFGGSSWVDVEEEDLWFQIWTDAAKVADGQAYDAGNGIEITKTTTNSLGAEIDYALSAQAFADSGQNILNTGVIQALNVESVAEQDERTGNTVNSRQKFEPLFSFVTSANLATLKSTSEPLIIGAAQDINPKRNTVLDKTQTLPGLAKGDVFTIVNPDPDLLSLNLLGSKLIPNLDNANKDYRIFKVTLCTDGYGDVNGDGYIDALDIARAAELVGEGILSSTTQQKIIDGYISTLELLRADVNGDGYVTSTDVTLITQYVNRQINSFPAGSSFQHLSIQVQQSIGRYDGYYDCDDGYVRLDGYEGDNVVESTSLNAYELLYDGYNTVPSIDGNDSAFTTVTFAGTTFRIKPQPFWQDYLLVFSSDARTVQSSFTYPESIVPNSCSSAALFSCTDRSDVVPEADPGRNDIFVPDNFIIGKGQILRPDGSFYPVDFEIGQIILQLPEVQLTEASINIFNKFVVDAGNGYTSAGYPALRFADCSTVQSDALVKKQLRFNVSIQSLNYNLDGYDSEDGYSVIVNDGLKTYMDHSTGILTITVSDLAVDPVVLSKTTRIQVTVFLKKAGFKNSALVVDSDAITGLISS